MTKERFKVPTESQILEYGLSIGYRINAAKFLAYYDARGWMMGKTPIKSWKACVRTWKIRSQENNGDGIFKPVPKESDSDRIARRIKEKLCIQCISGRIEWDEDRQKHLCSSCNTDLSRYFK